MFPKMGMLCHFKPLSFPKELGATMNEKLKHEHLQDLPILDTEHRS